jgi:hypothetical protein
MPARICTHRRDHTRTYMLTYARSCPNVYAHIGTIMPVHIEEFAWLVLPFLLSSFLHCLTQPGRLGIQFPSCLCESMVPPRPCLMVTMNTQIWFPKNIHEVHVLLSVNKVGGSTMYQAL